MDPAFLSLDVSNLTAVRGGRTLFRGLSFAVPAGSMLAVEGANGAGKTSLLRLLAGFLAPAEGKIRLRTKDRDIADSEERGRHVGWLGHHDAVKAQMSVAENLAFFAQLHGGTGTEVALQTVGLARLAAVPGQYLSAGQKKRLALARLVVGRRPLWLMDEPLASLDAEGKTIAVGLIAGHCANGGIAVVATHEPLAIDCERLAL